MSLVGFGARPQAGFRAAALTSPHHPQSRSPVSEQAAKQPTTQTGRLRRVKRCAKPRSCFAFRPDAFLRRLTVRRQKPLCAFAAVDRLRRQRRNGRWRGAGCEKGLGDVRAAALKPAQGLCPCTPQGALPLDPSSLRVAARYSAKRRWGLGMNPQAGLGGSPTFLSLKSASYG